MCSSDLLAEATSHRVAFGGNQHLAVPPDSMNVATLLSNRFAKRRDEDTQVIIAPMSTMTSERTAKGRGKLKRHLPDRIQVAVSGA